MGMRIGVVAPLFSLSAEELRRLTLRLDRNREFFAACEDPQAQVRGEIVKPSIE